MPENSRTHIERVLSFLLKEGADKTCRINAIGIFIANDQAQFLPEVKATLKHMDIFLQLLKGDPLLGQVEPFGACAECAHQCQIATPVSHHFDDETTPRSH